jgi:DnaK suppressor protein|tara:strand:- start:162 stop:620 length:459 start_codon:yes stop_codon:yes gene_type:complete
MPKKPVKKSLVKVSKKSNKKRYIPSVKEKYMCAKHKQFFTEELLKWKKDIINSNSLTNLLNSSDDSVSSADMVDQASSYTDKSVEMKALARSRKLIEKIESALRRIKDDTYGYCDETSEPIGLKRLVARPIATLSIEAQERHERDEKIFIED